MADSKYDTRYPLNRHDPDDPRTAASPAAPHQPGAGVVSEAAVERGQNLADGTPETEFTAPDTEDELRASSKVEVGNADADTGHKAEKLGTKVEPTDRADLEQPAAAVSVEGGVARPAETDSSSSGSSKKTTSSSKSTSDKA